MQSAKPKSMASVLIKTYLSLVLVLAVDAHAESKIYKYVDKNGVVSYSSKTPSDEINAETVDIPEGNIIHKRKLTDKVKEFQKKDKELSKKLDQRIKARKKRDSEIASARQNVKKRKEALENGKIVQPGDRVGTVYGHSRLRPRYISRVKRLEEQLAAAEKKLKDIESKYKQ